MAALCAGLAQLAQTRSGFSTDTPSTPPDQLWESALRLPVQDSEELFETVSQCLLSGMDRDALSGWGAVVYVMCAPSSPEHLTLCFAIHAY